MYRGYESKLDNNLILKIAKTDADFEKVIEINNKIHGEEVGIMINDIRSKSPLKNEYLFIFIEDTTTQKAVSTIAFCPDGWLYDDVQLKTCRFEYVATLEEYRGRGLIKIQNGLFNNIMKEKGYLLSAIEGIPYYYRRFGYDYALPLICGYKLNASQIPDSNRTDINIRLMTNDDLNDIEKLYVKLTEGLMIKPKWDKGFFLYRNNLDRGNEYNIDTYIIEREGKITGYFCLNLTCIEPGIMECACFNFNEVIEILSFVKKLMPKDKQNLVIDTHESSTLIKAAKYLGGGKRRGYCYQIYIPDTIKFIQAIKSVIEKRLEESIFYDFTQNFTLNTFDELIKLDFDKGKLVSIERQAFKPCDEVRIQKHLLPKLFLGDKSWDELEYIFPDLYCRKDLLPIVKTIFPKLESFLYTTRCFIV